MTSRAVSLMLPILPLLANESRSTFPPAREPYVVTGDRPEEGARR
jgi:hypothetical protein